jgi:hypothetical protein
VYVKPHFVYPDGYSGYFHLMAIVTNAAANVGVQVFILSCFSSSGYLPRSGIAGSSGNLRLNLLRNHQTVCHSIVALMFPPFNVEGSKFSTTL